MLKETDSDSTLEELNKALYSLASGKGPEKDRILVEVLKLYEILSLLKRG